MSLMGKELFGEKPPLCRAGGSAPRPMRLELSKHLGLGLGVQNLFPLRPEVPSA